MSLVCPIYLVSAGTAYSKYHCRCAACKIEHKKYYTRSKTKILKNMKKYNCRHKDEIVTYKKQNYLKNKDKIWGQRIIRAYGITPRQYALMFLKQKEKCAICGGSQRGGRKLSVDHDHKSNKLRGLLCNSCNSGLGSFKDKISSLKSAINYLKNKGGHYDK